MKKTGLEIVEMIAKGEAPKKIKYCDKIWEFNKYLNTYTDAPHNIDLLKCLNTKFEIIEEKLKVWKPEHEEKYYILNEEGEIYKKINFDSNEMNWCYEIGNCFKTEEEAFVTVEKIKIYTRLKRYAEEHNTEKVEQWGIYYDINDNKVRPLCNVGLDTLELGNIYFTSKKIVEEAIQEIGEDNIKKLFE